MGTTDVSLKRSDRLGMAKGSRLSISQSKSDCIESGRLFHPEFLEIIDRPRYISYRLKLDLVQGASSSIAFNLISNIPPASPVAFGEISLNSYIRNPGSERYY